MYWRIIVAAVAAWLIASPAWAQSTAGMSPCNPTATKSLSVSGTSSEVQIPNCSTSRPATTVIVYNVGSQEAFYRINTSAGSTAATTAAFSLPGLTYVRLAVPAGGGYIAAITASSTTTLRLVPGNAQ